MGKKPLNKTQKIGRNLEVIVKKNDVKKRGHK